MIGWASTGWGDARPPLTKIVGIAMSLRSFNKYFAIALDWAIGLIMMAIVVILFIGVIMRYVFNAPLFWSEELTVLGLIWMTFLAGAILVRDDKNVSITILTDICPPRVAKLFRIIAEVLVLFILGVMIWQSWQLTSRLSFSTTPALRICESWYGYALAVGFILMLYYQVQKLYRLIFGRSEKVREEGGHRG